MKILVFSDSHNNTDGMSFIIDSCKEDTSLIVHLGDMCADMRRINSLYPDIPFVSVKGNNDFFEVEGESEYIGILEGIKCLFTHGHQYGVKRGISGISVRARALKSELVLFGHTHIPFKEKHSNILFFNPGSIGDGSIGTFGIIHLSNCRIQSADLLTYNAITKEIDFLRSFK